MIIIPDKFRQHLNSDILTLALCWKISTKTGLIIAYTNHDNELMIDNILYKPGINISNNSLNHHANINNEQFRSYAKIENINISELDIINGILDDAEVTICLVNYQDVAECNIVLKSGNISKVKLLDGNILLEIRSLKSLLNIGVNKNFSKKCRAEFGGSLCKMNKNEHKIKLENFVIKQNIIYSVDLKKYPDGYFEDLECIYNNVTYKILGSHNGNIILEHNLENHNDYSTEITIVNGCDKNFSSCCNKFKNAINFRGEPHIPENLFLDT
jgi:uncharacterized phage protein (TIGR02218 family)